MSISTMTPGRRRALGRIQRMVATLELLVSRGSSFSVRDLRAIRGEAGIDDQSSITNQDLTAMLSFGWVTKLGGAVYEVAGLPSGFKQGVSSDLEYLEGMLPKRRQAVKAEPPTEDEITRRCRQIRESWSAKEEWQRRVEKSAPVEFPSPGILVSEGRAA